MRWRAVLLGIALAGCPRPTPGPTPPAPPPPDSGVPVGCQEACRHGRALGCASAAPSEGGVTCEEICALAAQGGLKPDCRILAPDCATFDRCR